MANKGKHMKIFFTNLVLCLFILTTGNSCAKDNTKVHLSNDHLSINFDKLRTTKSVTFFLAPWPDIPSDRAPKWDEDTLKQFGCNYTTKDSNQILSLIEIIRRSNLKKIDPSDPAFDLLNKSPFIGIAIREGVYLTLADGTETKFLLSLEYGAADEAAPVQFIQSQLVGNLPLYANHDLPWYLAFWLSHLGQPVAKDADSIVECNRYIKRHVYPQ